MINCLRSIVSMRLPAIALFKFFNASYKLTESGTIATEMRSVLDRNHPVTGTVATETGGTMATETHLNSLAQHHRNDWHNMTEKAGTMATELSSEVRVPRLSGILWCFLCSSYRMIYQLLQS